VVGPFDGFDKLTASKLRAGDPGCKFIPVARKTAFCAFGSEITNPTGRPVANDVGLVPRKLRRRWQPRSMQPGIIQKKTTFESLPEFEPSAPLGRNQDLRVRRTDQVSLLIALKKVPFAKKAVAYPHPRSRSAMVCAVTGSGSK